MTTYNLEQRRENLGVLADYLSKLPEDYQGFEMRDFFETLALRERRATPLDIRPHPGDLMDEVHRVANEYAEKNGGVARCGAVACAVGHGPAAGFLFLKHELGSDPTKTPDWFAYSSRVFLADEENIHGDPFNWMFGGQWSSHDNTPHGAAKRIRYYLEHGVPEEYHELSTKDLVPLYQEY